MGVFTDIYSFGAAVSKPVSGVLKYGAKQVDSLIAELVDTESTNPAKYGLTDEQLVKAFKMLSNSDMDDGTIASILNEDNNPVSAEQVARLRADM